ncbi:MAG: TonB-dependent receptor [Chitinophagales bacterium]|nr:TonB-dependent receptor [Chitinophagales bacterium]MCZ2393546.1 TonB-dependent receptor [Chitinophagales bacterium]
MIIVFSFAHNLFAQEQELNDTIQRLEEVIINYQVKKNAPISFQDIYSEEIKIKNVGQEPSFLLSETPSITNYSDAGASNGYSYFRIRGIDQSRINLTLDGVPLNEPEDQGGYFSNYPDIFNSVSKIQVQRGVGSTKNGVASYGGSVQLFSPLLADSSQTTFGVNYGSYNSLRAFAEYNSGLKNRKGLYARISEIYSDGYKKHAFNHSQSAYLSGGIYNDKAIWKMNALVGHQQNGMSWIGVSDSLIRINRRTNGNSKDEKDNTTQALFQILNQWQISSSSSLQSSVYYTYLKSGYFFDYNNFLGLPSTNELYKYDMNSHFLGFFSNYSLSKKSIQWTSGIHANYYKKNHHGSEKTLGPLYSNIGYKNEASIFSKINYNYKWLNIMADVQYRYVMFNYKGTAKMPNMDWHFISPKLGINANIQPKASLYYSIGYTGREPTRNDIFGGNDDLLTDSLGNAMLFNTTPEYVTDHEIGLRYQNQKLNFNINLYYMDFKNEIVLDGNFGPNGLALTNHVEKSYRTGIEISLDYKINAHFSISNQSSFNYSRIKEQSEKFSPILTPAFIINQEVSYANKGFNFAVSGRFQSSSYINFANTSQINSYFLLNARASYQYKKFQFSLYANNLSNTKYYNHGYVEEDGTKKYFTQAPINYSIGIQYKF